MKPQIIEICSGCGSREVVQERDAGWITGSWRTLRCNACGQKVLHRIPGWTIALYVIAGAAAICAVWTVLR